MWASASFFCTSWNDARGRLNCFLCAFQSSDHSATACRKHKDGGGWRRNAPLEGVLARDPDRLLERADDAVTDSVTGVAARAKQSLPLEIG